MPGLKRSRDEGATASSSKKYAKSYEKKARVPTSAPEEVHFPRGGGTGLTPLEYRETKAEARTELANETLFKDASDVASSKKRSKQKQKVVDNKKKHQKQEGGKPVPKPKAGYIRVEHLNYKKLVSGSRVLCSVLAVHPLAVVVSLPNQLLGHISATQISPQFTARLQKAAEASEEEVEEKSAKALPELRDLFHVGQWLRASVITVLSAGATQGMGTGREGGEYEKESRRVELSLSPHLVNEGVNPTDVSPGSTLSASIASVEDHGYTLDTGIEDFAGFLTFKDTSKLPESAGAGLKGTSLQIGNTIQVKVTRVAENLRTFECTSNPTQVKESVCKTAPSITAVVPGTLVQALVTASYSAGLNVKLWGMFDATIDTFHLPWLAEGKTVSEIFKIGSKIKARVLWDMPVVALDALDGSVSETERRFGLSAAAHVVNALPPAAEDGKVLSQAYPIGTTVEVTVKGTENDWGLTCKIADTPIDGFVHISQVADEHVVALPSNSGPFKIGTTHKARVIGHAPTDKLLQLSLKPSVLEKKFMRVSEVTVGEIMKATIKKVSSEAIILQLNGNVDGVVFPCHLSDITLKNPEKKFKPGLMVKARVLRIDPSRNRISLTLKKTLLQSDLPVVATIEDAKVGVVTHATITMVKEKSMLVDLFGDLRALVPISEAAEEYTTDLRESFSEGKVVKVRLTDVDLVNGRITASIRQTSPTFLAKLNVDAVEIGEKVTAKVIAVHANFVALTLVPYGVQALVSIKILANLRSVDAEALKTSLKAGEEITNLTVTQKNKEKGLVLLGVSHSKKASTTTTSVKAGDVVSALVTKLNEAQQESMIQILGGPKAFLHLTDCSDDFSDPQTARLPEEDETISCYVLPVTTKKNKSLLQVSTRPSRLETSCTIVDEEITSITHLKKGQTYRGFIKTIADSGLFVSLGRTVIARVQIRELFDNYVKNWKSCFTPGQVVEGTIMTIDSDKVEFSLRSEPGTTISALKEKREAAKKAELINDRPLADFNKGDKVKGFIRATAEFGVFIQVEGTSISGLCHRSEITDSKGVDGVKAFKVGDRVRAVVLDVAPEKKRISFGLKPSYFDADDFEDSDEEEGMEDSNEEMQDLIEEDESDADLIEEDESDTDLIEMDETPSAPTRTLKSKAAMPALSLSSGFSWSSPSSESGSSSDDEEATTRPLKKSQKPKECFEQDLTADMTKRTPSTNTDFERLLLGSPNSSYLWIQFMSFQLELSDVEKAREIGRRALKVISFREEQEKLNVWLALLNLENTFGSSETLEAVFKEAAQANDALTVHLAMVQLLEKSEKMEKAEEVLAKSSKKLGASTQFWGAWNEFLLRQGREEDARQLLPRSLQALEKRHHIENMSTFALNEFKYGQAERGRTIFEGLVDSYAKRLDLWLQYIDQEAKAGNVTGARNLFERVLALKLSSKKAKSLLKKWLDFEKTKGDVAGKQAVLARARQFVQERKDL